jgi:hypothetical protein
VHFDQDGRECIDLFKLHGSISWKRPTDSAPHIIPPTWNKSLSKEDHEIFDPIWTGASAHISEAERLIFIGYSLPPTDQYFRQFLAYSLAKNEQLRKVIVVDPSERTINTFRGLLDESFRAYFKPFKLKFEDLLKPRSSEEASQCTNEIREGKKDYGDGGYVATRNWDDDDNEGDAR